MPDRLHALAFNELSRALSDAGRFVALSERDEITRRVVDVVRGEIAADLKRAAAGRREYAAGIPERKHDGDDKGGHLTAMRQELLSEADHYESAALLVEDPRHLMGAVPSWRWTDVEVASLDKGEAR
jgi:hypothetical protein